MNRLIVLFVAPFLFAASCERTITPTPEPQPTPTHTVDPVPPPAPAGGCAEYCASLSAAKCSEWSPTCEADCQRVDALFKKRGSPPRDHSCVINASTCEAKRLCK